MEVERNPTHGNKLRGVLENGKTPDADRPRIEEALKRYETWVSELASADGKGEALLSQLVTLLNSYKRFVELDLIFDAEDDFLYRQKGQLKLDNSVLEEFLPYLFDERLVPGLGRLTNLHCGPQSSFSGLSFESPFTPLNAGGVYIKLKDQDFSVSKSHRLAIYDGGDVDNAYQKTFSVSHFASEIKTNLDKTMFQEASQTAAELKRAVPGARYVLLCEFLDMTPITTKLTSIDEVIVLRRAKRLGSNVRANFATAGGRKQSRADYESFLADHPFSLECFARFVWHLNEAFPEKEEDAEDVVLGRGYF